MRSTLGRRALRDVISLGLGGRMSLAYAGPAGEHGQRGLQAAVELDAALAGATPELRRSPVTRDDFVHMRSLQTLDAEGDGASERAIAELAFGPFDEPRAGTTAPCAQASATCSTTAAVFATAATATPPAKAA